MNRFMLACGLLLTMATFARAEIRMQQVEYHDGDTVLEGYLAYDDVTQDLRPAVLVCPEWWGLTDYAKHRADQLAKMGYIAFAADIYGKGAVTEDPQQAGKWHAPFVADRKLMRQRGQAALDTLLAQKYVDPTRVAAIGYCFGGTVALELARAGAPLAGTITFHGDLSRTETEGPDNIKGKILVCHGGADTFVGPKVLASFEAEMKQVNANYQINIYSGAVHAFTNPAADHYHLPGIGYNEQADKRSWAAAKDFFAEIFKQP